MKAAKLLGAVVIAAVWPVSHVGAQDKAPAPSASAKPSKDDEIVVVADSSQRSSIDRSTYSIRDTAEARSTSTLDLLRQVPAVEVTPQDEIRLLGVSGVKIQIDGKDVADPVTLLRNLQGSQIAKIEVISNPSARFSAQGTAGIINIVTRRSGVEGLRGSATAEGGSFDTWSLRVSPTWTRRSLSASGTFGINHSAQPNDFERDLILLDASGATASESVERRHTKNDFTYETGELLGSYKPTDKQTISLSGWAWRTRGNRSGLSETVIDGDAANARSRSSQGRFEGEYADVSADYKREGPRDGEELTVSADWSGGASRNRQSFLTEDSLAGETRFATRADSSQHDATFKIDYILPFAHERRLSFGGALQNEHERTLLDQSGESAGGTNLAFSSDLEGSWLEEAGYLTYQSRLLGGTILAGLRLEGRRYSFAAGAPIRSLDRSHAFPSLHLEHKLGKKITADLSFSRRVGWPSIDDLNPQLRFSDPTSAFAGNPDLRPEITDALEAKASGRFGRHNVDVTAFSRRTSDSFSVRRELSSDGVFVTQRVNLGTRTSQGVAVALRGALGRRFRYSLNANLADFSYSSGLLSSAGTDAGVQYGGSVQLEYREGSEGHRGSDHITLNARFSGPTNSILYRAGGYVSGDLSWSHGVTDRFSSVLRISNILGPVTYHQTYYSAGSISRDNYRSPGPTFKVSLIYSLSGSQPPQAAPSGPAPPGP